MYEICVRRHFDAAHGLRGYQGKCENLHGHRWEIVACARADALDEVGIGFDFTAFKRVLDGILERFDHHNLNETPPFDAINPSSENIARTIYHALQEALPQVRLEYVQSYESPDAWATYRES